MGELIKETIGHNGMLHLWIFGNPYNRGIKPAVLLSLSYSCLGSSPFLCKDRSVEFIFRSIEAVGSLLMRRYVVESLNNARIFLSYSSLSRTTTARPLSAGSTIILRSSFSFFKAFFSLEVMLDCGTLDLSSKPIICNRADSAIFLCVTLRRADSTFETMLGIGILFGVTAKLRPFESLR